VYDAIKSSRTSNQIKSGVDNALYKGEKGAVRTQLQLVELVKYFIFKTEGFVLCIF